ncbi:MAG TPA: formate dehydrogenase [Hyphomicrobiales bacterium]|nr:formate dehydrogenase [Rhodobiaceae bacterium]HXK53661.1 formate dehydrogenase [Hyphomicrobiales bacterium]
MSADAKTEKAGRRGFLKLISLSAAFGGALALTKGKAEAGEAEPEDNSGYRESEHVKTYYKLARF